MQQFQSPFYRFIPPRAGNTHCRSRGRPGTTVHPRTGGEHSSHGSVCFKCSGSSPHGRGTHRHVDVVVGDPRFIPARAGNTIPASTASSVRSVHPRTGGEHLPTVIIVWSCIGSSPHGRGTRASHSQQRLLHRFIPARAGNTRHSLRNPFRVPVHPRTGGEHWCIDYGTMFLTGSSPHGRGTRRDGRRADDLPVLRFIPARAGNTRASMPALRHPSPRRFIPARAGNTQLDPSVRKLTAGDGSSPHGRGTPVQRPSSRPVRMESVHPRTGGEHGRALIRGFLRRVSSVHPRTGGEHGGYALRKRTAVHGSSPHGRGTQSNAAVDYGHHVWLTGSSPHGRGTRASSGSAVRSAACGSSPHGRGTQPFVVAGCASQNDGSSPHGRGTRA